MPPQNKLGFMEPRAWAAPGADLHWQGVCRVQRGFPKAFILLSLSVSMEPGSR